jgi:hypothetical protein
LEDAHGFPVNIGFTPTAPPVLADVDRDGYLDIVAVGGGVVAVYARNGAVLPDFPVVAGRLNDPDSGLVAPVVADYGAPDRLAILSAGEKPVVDFKDGRGDPDETFRPLGEPGPNRLGRTRMITGRIRRCSDGYLYAYTMPGISSPPASAVWPMAFRDARLTSTVPTEELEPLNVDEQFFIAERAFVYPNPASDQAIVRYWLGDDASVRIRIFDPRN